LTLTVALTTVLCTNVLHCDTYYLHDSMNCAAARRLSVRLSQSGIAEIIRVDNKSLL